MKRINLKFLCLITLTNLTCQLFGQQVYDLRFDKEKYVIQTLTADGKTFKVRAYENIVYVANPVDTTYEKLNIYIPKEYFEGKSINGYTAQTAPIFFPNKIEGYLPSTPATTRNKPMGDRPPFNEKPPMGDKRPEGMPPMEMMGGSQQSAVLVALSKGYVVASAGTRGRTTKNADGTFTGKSPAALVDLKAAIRYLKFNDSVMPGDANKIISNGTSAGGAMSTLLGATGNNPDYEPFLNSLGAANTSDDIFAVSAYCPITNLDYADIAYEWQFAGIYTYRKGFPMQQGNQETSQLDDRQIKVSKDLAILFPAYINSLNLRDKDGSTLSLDENGNGNFKELVKSYVIASAQKALDSGTDMSKYTFLTISNGKVSQINFDVYLKYMGRQKTPPAFDALDLSTPENQEFGTESIDKQHFTKYAMDNSTVNSSMADEHIVKMLNPMYYIGQPETITAKHWRIRHGSKDNDTGLAIPVILGTYLQNKGFNVNIEFPWDRPHSGDYDLAELFDWIDTICR